jgi:hypothetical protein
VEALAVRYVRKTELAFTPGVFWKVSTTPLFFTRNQREVSPGAWRRATVE